MMMMTSSDATNVMRVVGDGCVDMKDSGSFLTPSSGNRLFYVLTYKQIIHPHVRTKRNDAINNVDLSLGAHASMAYSKGRQQPMMMHIHTPALTQK
jgi:hypothetical protein